MSRRAYAPLFLFVLVLAAVTAITVVADESADRRLALREAQEPLRARDWPAAAGALRAFRQAYPGTDEAREAWVLEARARLRAGAAREALDLTTAFLDAHGDSAWAGRVKHTAADAYAALEQPGKAAEVLKERVESSTAPVARAALAALHVKLADQDFDGVETKDDLGRTVKKQDVARALASYTHALAMGLEGAEALRVRERIALSYEVLKRYPDAARVWDGLLKDDGEGTEEKRPPEAEARRVRLHVGRGRAYLRAGKADEARKDLREALARQSSGDLHMEILLLLGEERLTHGKDEAAFEQAVTWFRRAVLEHRDDERAVMAQRTLAEAYQMRSLSEKAAAEWGAVVERFPDSEFVPAARNQQALALRNAGKYDEAIRVWERFLSAHPNHALWQEVKASIVAAAFAKGDARLEEKDVGGAVAAWQAFAQAYPTHANAPEGLLRAGRAQLAAEETMAAIELWRQIAGRYTKSPQAPQALLLVAQTLETKQGRLEDAVKAYEEVIAKYGPTNEAGQARSALTRLKAFHLELRMDRVVGSGEAPVVRVASRNIPALDVRVYRLEMEEYFRRKGTVRGVENLQLEVVKPDITARWEIDPYRPFALLEADRKVPVDKAGAYVVVAADEHLTATLLFLVSDVECVVKKSRGEQLFVWSFAREGQAPVPAARILVNEGGKVREVGKTGADGVWKGRGGSTATNVLVVADAGLASVELQPGEAVASGFQSKAFVYTDAPVYRPGQQVGWRALFLQASGGSYLPPKARSGRVTVLDARGQTLFQEKVTSSAFGTFTGTFPLDLAAPLGVWKVQLEVPRVGTWTGEFEVQEFRKPEFTLELIPGRPVYLTGEKVSATARLAYAFGGPVADAAVSYEVLRYDRTFAPSAAEDYAWYFKDDRQEGTPSSGRGARQRIAKGVARTGANGEAVVTFETADRDQDAEYRIVVSVEDVTRRWIVADGWIPVTRSDHMAVVKADRRVYRPQEEMRIEVRTLDASQRSVARSGELVLMAVKRRPAPTPLPERRGGRVVRMVEEEIERAAYPLSTSAGGSAELKLKVPGPGRWRLRWRAMDGRGTLVTAYTDVEATGEALDPSRDVRLVAAKAVYTEGDEAEVLLSSPVTGVKALLTYEGEEVLAYRFVDVQGSSTLLSLPLAAAHAPNVFFSIAIPAERRLLEAEAEVVVLRTLQVDVELPKTAGPGEKIEVTVRATDARGNPVAAEVGLALIDETLFAVARDRIPAIRPYFYDRRRKNAVQTANSLAFQAYGTTTETNQDLLADEAARSGDLRKAMAASSLQGAVEALARGDVRTAAVLGLRAAEADPESFEARAFLATLRENRQARKKLASADIRLLQELKRTAPLPPSASPTPDASWGRPGDEEAEEDMDELDDAPFEGPANNGLIGLGGGAGGSFGGRGGSRTKSAGGGGRRQRQIRHAVGAEMLAQLQHQGVSFKDATMMVQDAFGFEPAFALETRKRFADVATWMPGVVTDKDGKAVVTVELPDNLTTWRAVARGVSSQALVGEGRGSVVAKKDLHVRIDTPRFLVQTDEVTIPLAVHNGTGAKQTVRVSATAEGVTLSGADETLTIEAGGRGISDRETSATALGASRIEATAIADGGADRTEARFPTLPRGIRVTEGRSGTIDTRRGDTAFAKLEVPAGAIPGAGRLAVVLYPGFDAALLDALLYLDLFPYGCIEQTVHRFLPAIDARVALRQAGSPAAARLDRLDEAIKRGALRLRNLQNQDGSFGWFRGGKGDLAMTAYALLGLAGAREAGVANLDQPIVRTADALAKLVKAGGGDTQALGHLALAKVGRIERDAWATAFRRRRDDLSTAGLAWMARAAHTLGRTFDADEIAGLLLERRVEENGTVHWKGVKGDCFVGSDREATGLAVEALLVCDRGREIAGRGLDWLLASRVEGGFGTTKDTAAFVGAASAWVARQGLSEFGGTVEVLLGSTVVRTVKIGRDGLAAKDRRFLLDEARSFPAASTQRLGFRLRGQGRLHWAARFVAVVESDELPAASQGLEATRVYLKPEEAPVAGQPAPAKPGYGILREAARPRIEARQLQVVNTGDRVLVRVTLKAPRDLQYVLVEDPLPAGFEVLDETTTGPFDWQERRDDRQVFFCSKIAKGEVHLSYVLQATHWGRFTALGTTAHPMYLPEVHARAAGYEMKVAREPVQEADAEHGPTPDEVYARAKRLFDGERRAEAVALFRVLRDDQPLRDEIVEEIETYLLKAAVEAGEAKEIVRAREALVRRNPSRIPGDWKTQRAIAFAYHALEEYEMASSLYQDLVARGFGLHVDWTRTLTQRGREVEGLDALGRSLRSFPIANSTAEAAFRRAQRYRELPRPEGRDGEAGRPMDTETLDALWSYTAHFAETPIADPANYALVGALRRSGDPAGAAKAAEAFLARFPGSYYEDDAYFFLAASRFRTFEEDPTPQRAKAVREAARPLVERKFKGQDGRSAYSEFRTRAYHLLARVEHVLGNLGEAVRLYHAARELEDAREAWSFLTEERLDLEPTLTVPLAGGIDLPVRYRNVGEVTFKAYPVDLQVLFAVRKTLEGLHDVDLSGIVPIHQWTTTFPDGQDHLGHLGTVAVPVAAGKPGAWLVVAKAGDHEAKTLVVKTDLDVVLQRVGEKLRVYVTDGEGQNVKEAYVTVADGQRIRARGLTDGRGLFEAPGVGAGSAVVVSEGDRFAIGR